MATRSLTVQGERGHFGGPCSAFPSGLQTQHVPCFDIRWESCGAAGHPAALTQTRRPRGLRLGDASEQGYHAELLLRRDGVYLTWLDPRSRCNYQPVYRDATGSGCQRDDTADTDDCLRRHRVMAPSPMAVS